MTTFAAHERGMVNRFKALRGSGDDYTIDTPASRDSFSCSHWVFACSEVDSLRAERLGNRQLPRIKVDSEHTTAVSAQQLDSDKTDQPETCHHEGFAESRLSKPDAL